MSGARERARACGWLTLALGLAGLVLATPAAPLERLRLPTTLPEIEVGAVELLVHGTPSDLVALAAEQGLVRRRTLLALDAALFVAPRRGSDALEQALRADPRVWALSRNHSFEVAGGCCGGHGDHERGSPEEGFRAAHERLEASFGALHHSAPGGGAGVRVAVLDTGFDVTHPDLAVREGASVARSPRGALLPWERDPAGHGTAMASLVAARPAQPGRGLEGVAPGAELIGVRVCDDRGVATLADVAAGVVAAVDRGAQVVLLSLGARVPAPTLSAAIDYAERRGVLLVAAAGNANVHQDLWPAADERVLSVGCVRDDGDLAGGTALAATTDLMAPGVEVAVALPAAASEDGYAFVTGSSASAARVAGVAALALERRPDLDLASLRALLRRAVRPLPIFAEQPTLRRAFPAGILDPDALVRALAGEALPLRLEAARAWPQAALPGGEVAASVRVVNPGLQQSAPARLRLSGLGEHQLQVPALAPGAEVELSARLRVPADFRGEELSFRLGEAEARWPLRRGEAPALELAFVEARADADAAGGLSLRARVEGRGELLEGAWVQAQAGEVTLEPVELPPLAPGEVREVRFALTPAQVAAQRPSYSIQLELRAGDQTLERAALDLRAPGAKPHSVETQYQQNGSLNVVCDAPYRLEPGRSYLPLMVYLAEKGDLDPSTWVELDRTTIHHRRQAERLPGPGQLLYADVRGGSTTAPAGLVVLDEEGEPIQRAGAPDPRIFAHERIFLPGRYAILRLPRSALGAAAAPASPEQHFLELNVDWSNRRTFLAVASRTRTGRTRWVLRTTLASEARPRLPGEGAYYDGHVHTIAEWHQEDRFDLLAPRKNLGGPIPMVKESAYAIGLSDAVDAERGRLITTDHNAFLNGGDSLRDRPAFGPTSAASAGGVSEFERYRQLFGFAAAEEVAFSAGSSFFSSGPLSGIKMPTGAHMLTYRAEHIPGAWHGGSSLATSIGEKQPIVQLRDLLHRLAKTNRAQNSGAATFGAHPYSGGLSWEPEHWQAAFEHDPTQRDDLSVHVEGTGFVTKGYQLWNGDGGRHSLATSKIDWEDLNPWADAGWQRGNDDWDSRLWLNLRRYHQDHLEPLLDYELKSRPGVRFPRKVLGVAGNDAHGDFNYETNREATILDLKSTYTVSHASFGRVATYAFADLQDSQDPAERAFEAFLDGNSVLSDGPLLRVSLDAEGRFDGRSLQWHDQRDAHEDADGRIGGGGAFDGRGTALVPRGSSRVRYGYRYTNTSEFGERGGDVTHLAIYRTSSGDPNPTQRRASGTEVLEARGWLAPAGADSDLDEALDPSEEGALSATSALQFAAYTASPLGMGRDERRCLTNPIYAVPFDVDVQIERTETDAAGRGAIPPGALRVTFRFDMSLEAQDTAIEVKALDAQGDSSDASEGPIDVLVPVGANKGWSAWRGAENAQLTLTNDRALPLDLERYPLHDRVSFVVYSYTPLRDAFGNELNPIAHRFDTHGIGVGGGTGPAIARASTAPPATAAPGPAIVGGGGGGGGGGGCALEREGSAAPSGLAALLALLLALRLGSAGRRLGA